MKIRTNCVCLSKVMGSGPVFVVLLAGGDKSTQDADIKRAIEIAKEWKP